MKYTIVDGHTDLLVDVFHKRRAGNKKVIETDYLEDFISAGTRVLVCSIFIDHSFLPDKAISHGLKQITYLYEELKESGDKLCLCRNYEEVTKAIDENKLAILLSLEGAEPISNNLEMLEVFYDLGVRFLGLTWSRKNYVGEGSLYSRCKNSQGGLTKFGVELIKYAEKLGMVIDLSHLNDRGFQEVMDIVSTPVIASHSNSRELCNIMRNLTDEQIKRIKESGGIIGLNGVNLLVANDAENYGVKEFADQLEYIGNIIGMDKVVLGLDMVENTQSKMGVSVISVDGEPVVIKDIFKKYMDLNNLIEELNKRGFSDIEISNILGMNFMRFLEKSLI